MFSSQKMGEVVMRPFGVPSENKRNYCIGCPVERRMLKDENGALRPANLSTTSSCVGDHKKQRKETSHLVMCMQWPRYLLHVWKLNIAAPPFGI